METITIFAGAVAFIGIFHLLSTAIGRMTRMRSTEVVNSAAKRSDWYCFFNISSLCGQDDKSLRNDKSQCERSLRRDDILDQKRRRQARRPRLHV